MPAPQATAQASSLPPTAPSASHRTFRWGLVLVTSLTIVLAAGTLLGLGGGASAAPPRPGAATTARECGNADLEATYRATDAGAGHRYGRIVLTNVSDSACRTRGFGGLSYVGHGDGTQVGAGAVRDDSPVRTIVLLPGERVRSDVSETVAQNYPRRRCHPVPVDGFRVYVPDATVSQFVAHPTTGCARAAVHLIHHRAYRRP